MTLDDVLVKWDEYKADMRPETRNEFLKAFNTWAYAESAKVLKEKRNQNVA